VSINDRNRIAALEQRVRRLIQGNAPRQIGETAGGDVATPTLATRFDQVDPTLAYLGEAQPGVATSAASWRMRKLDFGVDGDVTVTWADGNASYDNVWDDRASLIYS
jgi:hypothetical protein